MENVFKVKQFGNSFAVFELDNKSGIWYRISDYYNNKKTAMSFLASYVIA